MRRSRIWKFLIAAVAVLYLLFTLALFYVTNKEMPIYIGFLKTVASDPSFLASMTNSTNTGGAVLYSSSEMPSGDTQPELHPTPFATVPSPNFHITERLGIDRGLSWPKGSFCDDFFSHKFNVTLGPCQGGNTSQVECYGSPFNNKMGLCNFTNLGVNISKYYATMRSKRDSIIGSDAIWLVPEHTGINPCPHAEYHTMERHMEVGDYVKDMAKAAIMAVPQGDCQEWVEGVTFFFIGFDAHIYFKFLSWYNLHNSIANLESTGTLPSTIIRIPESVNEFLFPEFEKKLFPEARVYSLKEFSERNNDIVCFRKAIVVPWAFSSTPFRCKMADSAKHLRFKCYNCNSRSLPGTRFQSFRRRVLNACSLKDPPESEKKTRSIVVLLRKPYNRFESDHPSRFSRVLKNSQEFITALRHNFPSADVMSVYLEDLSICEQVRLTHEADIFTGVHGAGLVHLWWTQDKALLFELVPQFQLANPTFKMLSALTGKQYYGFSRLGGSEKEVTVNIDEAIRELEKQWNNTKSHNT